MTQPKKITSEKELMGIAPKKLALYEEQPLTSLTAYSLCWLHAWELQRTIESIAVLNWRLFPIKFEMVGFPEFPDAFRTNRSLLQMQPKYRNLLTGAAVKGFSLNEHGMEKAAELIKVLGAPQTGSGETFSVPEQAGARVRKPTQARSIEPEREVERVRSSKLFSKWKQSGMADRDLIHVHALLQIFDHTPAPKRVRAMKELMQAATKVGDEEVERFLAQVSKTFPQILDRD